MTAPWQKKIKRRNLKIWAWFVAWFFVIDIVLFRWLIWQLPDETAWAGSPHYHFEYKLRSIEPKQPREFRVFIVGSSIAMYSLLPKQLEAQTNQILNDLGLNREASVYVLAHQGMTPLHLRTYGDRIRHLDPDLIVWPTNPVDHRLERPLMIGDPPENITDQLYPTQQARTNHERRAAALKRYTSHILRAGEFRSIAPRARLSLYSPHLTRDQFSADLFAILSGAYRYRDFAFEPVELYFSNRFTRGRSYHYYAGLPIADGNVSHRGWTGETFRIPVTDGLIANGFYIEAPQQLMDRAEELNMLPRLMLSLCDELDRCNDYSLTLRAGWQGVPLYDARPGQMIRARVEPLFYSSEFATWTGVRLTRNAGRMEPAERTDDRPVRREDQLYLDYDDEAYTRSFEERVLRFDRGGMEYLEAMQMAKRYWATRPFDPELPTFVAYQKFVDESRGIPLLVLNSPENPLSLAWYGDSRWYNGYVDFLMIESQSTCGEFGDLSTLLPIQKFYDYHHLSYYGAEDFTLALEPLLRALIAAPCAKQESGER